MSAAFAQNLVAGENADCLVITREHPINGRHFAYIMNITHLWTTKPKGQLGAG